MHKHRMRLHLPQRLLDVEKEAENVSEKPRMGIETGVLLQRRYIVTQPERRAGERERVVSAKA